MDNLEVSIDGGCPKWILMENPKIPNWMMTGDTPMTQETSKMDEGIMIMTDDAFYGMILPEYEFFFLLVRTGRKCIGKAGEKISFKNHQQSTWK